jgi:uncharacterized protein YgiM (DUF1202 family)
MVSNGNSKTLGYGLVSGVKTLSVRYGPGTGYADATYVSAGQYLPYFQKNGNWARTKYGWVSMNYFDVAVDVTGCTGKTTTDLNVREKASSSSKKLDTLKKKTEVLIDEVDGNWGLVEYESGEYGWVSLSYVLFDVDTTEGTGGSDSSEFLYSTGIGLVNTTGLNVREDPDADSDRVGGLSKGNKVTVLEVQDNWGKVEYKSNKFGWINLNYITMTTIYATGEGVVTAKSLNVRSGPGENYKDVGDRHSGNKVVILEVEGSWGKIEQKNGNYGWISLNYVRMTKVDEPSTSISFSISFKSMTNGTVTASSTSALAGETVTLTITPDSGYALKSLKVSGATVKGTGNERTFTMPAKDVTVTATFKKSTTPTPTEPPAAPVYTVTINPASNGTVTADKTSAKAGETVTLTAAPNSGYALEDLKVNSGAVHISGTGNQRTFTMPEGNVTVDATFKAIVTRTITVKAVDAAGNPLKNVNVALQTVAGDVIATKTTDANGIATFSTSDLKDVAIETTLIAAPGAGCSWEADNPLRTGSAASGLDYTTDPQGNGYLTVKEESFNGSFIIKIMVD